MGLTETGRMMILVMPFLFMVVPFFFCFGISAYVFVIWLNFPSVVNKRNHERWREITTIGNAGPGMRNPYGWLGYIYSDLDNDDPEIVRRRREVKFAFKLWLGSFVAIPASFAIGLIIAAFILL
jgi:hypothetical protein